MAQHNHFGVAQAKTVVDIMITKKKKNDDGNGEENSKKKLSLLGVPKVRSSTL